MKKVLVVLSICFLLIAGYIVGEIQKQGSGRKSSATYRDSNPRYSSIDSFSGDSTYEKEVQTNGRTMPGYQTAEDMTCDAIVPDCGYGDDALDPVNQNPNVGNPKGSKIIKTGSVEITIKRGTVTDKYDDIVDLIPDGGYIEASESTRRTSTLTVRIPSEKLDETLVALRKLGTITKESVNSIDRTYDSVDYDARLKIMREREAVLTELLKKATTANETLNIQEQIFSIREQIESTQGLKSVLDEQVALSTLQVTISEDGVKKHEVQDKSILSKAWTTSVGAMLTSLSGIMIVFTSILPLLVVGVLGIFLFRKLRKSNKTAKEDTKE